MKFSYFTPFFLILSIGIINRVNAQVVLWGEITDKTNFPVAGALVDFNSGFLQTVSDENGKFTLTYSDTLETRNIRVQAIGYKSKTMILNKGQAKIKVVLLDSIYSLGGVKVLASKQGRFSDYSAQTIRMSSFDIVTNPSAMADLIGNMRILPGVQTNDNDGRLIIQGGHPGESQVYINDLIVMNPYNLTSKNSGVRSRFSPDLFEGIVLQSGGSNAEFGQALSGIVNLNTKEKEQMEAKTDLSVASVFAELTHIFKKSTYACRASVNYTNLLPYEKLFPSQYNWSKYFQQLTGDVFFLKEYSSKTKLTGQVYLSHAGGEYTYENADGISLRNNLKQTYLYGQLNGYYNFNTKFSLAVASNFIFDYFSGTDVQWQNDKITNTSVWNHNKITFQYRNRILTNRTGAEFIYNPFKETYTRDKDYPTSLNNNLISVYNDTKLFLTAHLTASVGLRGEYSTYLNRFNVAPRIYVAYRIASENVLSLSLGEYFQLPSPDYLKLSNAIDFTSAMKGTLSYSYVKKNKKLQVDAYYKKYKNAITYSPGLFARENVANSGEGYGWGGDIFWKSNFKSLEYWLTYSFNQTNKSYAYFTEKIAPPYVAEHSLNITLKYWIAPLKSLIGCSYYISSGSPYYSPVEPYENLGVTPFHNRLDVSWSFLPKKWIILHFGCQNVLGYKNIYGYEYAKINPGVRKEIASPETRFFFLGAFITLSRSKDINQLKSL